MNVLQIIVALLFKDTPWQMWTFTAGSLATLISIVILVMVKLFDLVAVMTTWAEPWITGSMWAVCISCMVAVLGGFIMAVFDTVDGLGC